ncbi:hypothetical protein WM40_10295 [Robbsia andropogonis]|uniref:Uncharacterized protein n=1 Tax=Robbsia andropogonis TaxID=28092 RepID=A0A0F5K1A4_9BURK|nr:hypothetical protein WM40_10295 [Robbsia andropogonis]
MRPPSTAGQAGRGRTGSIQHQHCRLRDYLSSCSTVKRLSLRKRRFRLTATHGRLMASIPRGCWLLLQRYRCAGLPSLRATRKEIASSQSALQFCDYIEEAMTDGKRRRQQYMKE